jgi:polysaccharide export outer membrane protein
MLHNDTVSNSCSNKSVQRLAWTLAMLVALVMVAVGCNTTSPPEFPLPNMEAFRTNHTETVVLREGDTIKLTFPSAANLNTSPKIQRDGTISLQLVGEVKAAGKTLTELHEELLKVYKDQIESKQIDVELVSSEFPVYVTGAVLSPHKVMSDHPMTVLQAIMECGGFDYTKANMKSVTVLREDGKRLKSYTVDLKKVMKGYPTKDQFYVQPEDIVFVPERFNWF